MKNIISVIFLNKKAVGKKTTIKYFKSISTTTGDITLTDIKEDALEVKNIAQIKHYHGKLSNYIDPELGKPSKIIIDKCQ